MRAQQAGFDFDLFDMAGIYRTPIEEADAWIRQERERKARAERMAREQREREDQARREREHRARQARRTAYESPWDVLGVHPGAGKSEIRQAWVRACKRHHPDAGGLEEDMKRVNRAYNDLKGQMR